MHPASWRYSAPWPPVRAGTCWSRTPPSRSTTCLPGPSGSDGRPPATSSCPPGPAPAARPAPLASPAPGNAGVFAEFITRGYFSLVALNFADTAALDHQIATDLRHNRRYHIVDVIPYGTAARPAPLLAPTSSGDTSPAREPGPPPAREPGDGRRVAPPPGSQRRSTGCARRRTRPRSRTPASPVTDSASLLTPPTCPVAGRPPPPVSGRGAAGGAERSGIRGGRTRRAVPGQCPWPSRNPSRPQRQGSPPQHGREPALGPASCGLPEPRAAPAGAEPPRAAFRPAAVSRRRRRARLPRAGNRGQEHRGSVPGEPARAAPGGHLDHPGGAVAAAGPTPPSATRRCTWAGRLEWAHWLHPGRPAFQTWFSGSPAIYPPVGALADRLGGLTGARLLSLVFMLGATVLLDRLPGAVRPAAANVAAALFAVLGTVHSWARSRPMTRCRCSWWRWRRGGPRAAASRRTPPAGSSPAAAALALANATKYAARCSTRWSGGPQRAFTGRRGPPGGLAAAPPRCCLPGRRAGGAAAAGRLVVPGGHQPTTTWEATGQLAGLRHALRQRRLGRLGRGPGRVRCDGRDLRRPLRAAGSSPGCWPRRPSWRRPSRRGFTLTSLYKHVDFGAGSRASRPATRWTAWPAVPGGRARLDARAVGADLPAGAVPAWRRRARPGPGQLARR